MAQDVLQVARFRRCHLTIGNLLLRFALGGGLVSFFAALGSCFKPKTFAGLFGAAPPVALVSLGIAFVQQNPAHIRALTSSMVLGAIALCFYSGCCALLIQRKNIPVWLGAGLSWVGWGAVASGLFLMLKDAQ